MDIKVTSEQTMTVIHLKGRLDVLGSRDLYDRVTDIVNGGAVHIVFALDDVEYVSSSALRVFLHARKVLKDRKGQVVLCGVKEFVNNVLVSTGFDTIFRITTDVQSAMAAISA